MAAFKKIPLGLKVKLLIIVITTCASITIYLALVALGGKVYYDEQLSNLKAVSSAFAASSHVALAFGIPDDARMIVSSAAEMEQVLFAGIYDINGNLFAGYQRERDFVPPREPEFHGHEMRDGHLYFYFPILRGDRILGSICFVQEMDAFWWVMSRSLKFFLLVLLVVIAIKYVIATRMEKLILHPILEFTKKARLVAIEKDYTVRMRHDRQDELGLLASAFNMMVSQIKKQSEELEQANFSLEKRVKERTKELEDAQEKLLRTQKLALVGELAGTIAHELRTPLGVLKNSAYYLKLRLSKMTEDERIMRHIEIMEEEILSSDRIITDVLTFARVKQPELQEEDLNSILRDALKKVPGPDKVNVNMALENKLPKVYADRNQMMRVFCNLILNAYQSMPEGGDLLVSSKKVSHFVAAEISDTGVGISKDNIKKIFDPLFSTKVKGTGLGLSSCKTLISLHNGKLEVRSEVGEGSRFTVKLPFLAEDERYEPEQERS